MHLWQCGAPHQANDGESRLQRAHHVHPHASCHRSTETQTADADLQGDVSLGAGMHLVCHCRQHVPNILKGSSCGRGMVRGGSRSSHSPPLQHSAFRRHCRENASSKRSRSPSRDEMVFSSCRPMPWSWTKAWLPRTSSSSTWNNCERGERWVVLDTGRRLKHDKPYTDMHASFQGTPAPDSQLLTSVNQEHPPWRAGGLAAGLHPHRQALQHPPASAS